MGPELSKQAKSIKDGERARHGEPPALRTAGRDGDPKSTERVALVTGGARRLGRAIVLELARAGFTVAVHYHGSRDDAAATVREVEAAGGRALALRADLRRRAELEGLIGSVAEAWGRLDLLVNNASSFFRTPFGTVDEAQWDDLLGTNLKAPFFAAQLAAPLLQADGRGQIVNVLDAAIGRPWTSYLPYVAAKAGLEALTRGLARTLAPAVRVNAVAPGPVLLPDAMEASERRRAVESTLLKRAGTPEDIARTVAFLASGPDYLTGAIIAVDGGRALA
jgi:pteridine reductase